VGRHRTHVTPHHTIPNNESNQTIVESTSLEGTASHHHVPNTQHQRRPDIFASYFSTSVITFTTQPSYPLAIEQAQHRAVEDYGVGRLLLDFVEEEEVGKGKRKATIGRLDLYYSLGRL
jgi:hypothetical protein